MNMPMETQQESSAGAGDASQSASSSPSSPRPLVVRVLHTVVEVLLGLVLAAGILPALMAQLCRVKYRCDDLGSLPYLILSTAIAIAVFCGYMTLCKKYRENIPARTNLAVFAAVIAAAIWTFAVLVG